MSRHDPMDVLRDLADKKLTDTTNHLGKMRQEYAHANNQLTSLETYEQEYQQQMQSGMTDKGMTVIELLSHQSFIASLGKVINHQKHQVELCQHSVDNAVGLWHKDKQRLNAFDTLKQRAEVARVMQENRRDQKLMDEFAQRVTRRNT